MADFKQIRNFIPYWIGWKLHHQAKNKPTIDFYCDNITDYVCFKKILEHFPQVRVVAKNKQVKRQLTNYGVESIVYPSYPDIVIMCRHSAWRYPLKSIIKIGMRHGPYHFKDFIKAKSYNQFDSYLFTSPTEAKQAQELGIKNGVGVGFPKLDDAFDGTITLEQLQELRQKLQLDLDKPTVIFSATWSENDYSAILKWYDKLELIAEQYNILVTVHEWTPESIKQRLRETPNIDFIEEKEILPYLMLADLMVGDISSIIAEFTALNKPVITYRIPVGGRISAEIVEMLDEITYRVDTFAEMQQAIVQIIETKEDIHQERREFYNKRMFGELDGKAHLRAKSVIERYLKQLDKSKK